MTAYRGTVLHFSGDPAEEEGNVHLVEDGALLVDPAGHVEGVAPWAALTAEQRAGAVQDFRDDLIVPGFVDAHAHSGQIDAIASPGGDLMAWLTKSVYPAEMRFQDPGYARRASGAFLDTMLAAGTTTACVHTTTSKEATGAFFAEAHARNMRVVAGKVLMDDGGGAAPAGYLDASVGQAEDDCRELIERWHGRGRVLYAVTPRFGPTSTEGLLRMAGRLYQEHPGLWMQSHLAETRDEVDQVLDRFADLKPRSYLDVYDRCGMVGPRSVWAHCVWPDHVYRGTGGGHDWDVLRDKGAGVAFCPTSNLFLGSGLFPFARTRRAGVRVGLGTDIGAGTSYSLLATAAEAYKVAALQGEPFDALRGLYLATRGGAEALSLQDRIGGFHPGAEADFAVLDFAATPVLKRRTEAAADLRERLFALMVLGDERAVRAVFVNGRRSTPGASGRPDPR
ncbi:guanine deaminase [Actinomadura macrotermitis]|uniref:Guanine deaminase n=1 Tax=Actinomadura macrotermitis TaxID=2585200 RepID=A0A7K0C295_9ACTN|nr:guanine deaminase [Actinomadura macrotermitis]MQY07538.1 Guanine deaminase [Actinomadura macrotermitis]